MSLLPPGRFLMPGNLAGSPALTFAPLDVPADGTAPEGSLWAMMVAALRGLQGRGGAAVLPRSFRAARSPDRAGRCALGVQRRTGGAARSRSGAGGHSRLLPDRPQHVAQQPVPAADRPHPVRRDQGRSSASFQPRPAGGGVAADRRPAPSARAEDTGAAIDVVALAAVRATREAMVARGRDKLPSILGTPAPGEIANGETFDGNTEVATFPGDLPADPEGAVRRRRRVSRPLQRAAPTRAISASCASARRCSSATTRDEPALPHIRLDRALQFLIGDRLQ